MRWQRGSDGWESAKGGGTGASSKRGYSRCEGEGRRGAASIVSRGRGESIFYWVGGRAGRSGGGWPSGGRWCFIKVPVMEEEARRQPFDEREMKRVGHRFGLTPSGCRRVAHSDADQRGSSGSGIQKWEKTLGWADLSRSEPRAGPTQKKSQGKWKWVAVAVCAKMQIGLQNRFLN
jgi:hypothetical protein